MTLYEPRDKPRDANAEVRKLLSEMVASLQSFTRVGEIHSCNQINNASKELQTSKTVIN